MVQKLQNKISPRYFWGVIHCALDRTPDPLVGVLDPLLRMRSKSIQIEVSQCQNSSSVRSTILLGISTLDI
jgi:hypothetical protein